MSITLNIKPLVWWLRLVLVTKWSKVDSPYHFSVPLTIYPNMMGFYSILHPHLIRVFFISIILSLYWSSIQYIMSEMELAPIKTQT